MVRLTEIQSETQAHAFFADHLHAKLRILDAAVACTVGWRPRHAPQCSLSPGNRSKSAGLDVRRKGRVYTVQGHVQSRGA